jgi:DNA-binding MarR family transcriptional regulator
MHAPTRPTPPAAHEDACTTEADAPSGTYAGPCTCSRVRELARRLTALYDAALAPHGLTVTQFAALAALHRADAPLAVADLARRLQMDRTTTSRLVVPLESEGLVARTEERGAGADARARPLRLSAQGRRRLLAAVPAWRIAQQRVERQLGAPLHAELQRVAVAAGRALAEAQPAEAS